ncbi:MAG: hypothetical protein RBS17_01340, partial [Coriobacteriia bacterium]|nr:hypothetical protein [Coriobacteriia bacterium]
MVKRMRPLLVAVGVVTLLVSLALFGVLPTAATAATASGFSEPFTPAAIAVNKPFTVTGFVDKAAATGPIKLLFYQNIRGSWVLQKTEYARWSGYTDTVTKYLADVTVPYEGTWRIGASYGGNEAYASEYKYRDLQVGAKLNANATGPMVPYWLVKDKPFTVTGFVDKAAATGPIKLLFYQNIRGSWY